MVGRAVAVSAGLGLWSPFPRAGRGRESIQLFEAEWKVRTWTGGQLSLDIQRSV